MLDYAKMNSIITRKSCHKQRRHVLYQHKILMRKDFFPLSGMMIKHYIRPPTEICLNEPLRSTQAFTACRFIFQKGYITTPLYTTHSNAPAKQCMPALPSMVFVVKHSHTFRHRFTYCRDALHIPHKHHIYSIINKHKTEKHIGKV